MSLAAAASKGLPALYDRIGTDKNNTFRILQDFMSSLAASLPPQMGITDQAAAPITLLDNACGLGVFTQMARAALPKGLLAQSSFLCADNNAAQIEKVKKLIEDEGWNNTEAKVLDAMVCLSRYPIREDLLTSKEHRASGGFVQPCSSYTGLTSHTRPGRCGQRFVTPWFRYVARSHGSRLHACPPTRGRLRSHHIPQ